MKIIWVIFILISKLLHGQAETAVFGNQSFFCSPDTSITHLDEIPKDLSPYKSIFIFSNATSLISKYNAERLISYVKNGGGLYIGSENWPLQAEAQQLTQLMYNKEHFGEFRQALAEKSPTQNNLELDEIESLPAGNSTVAFPLDYRLKVEAWVEDQPLILSGEYGAGRIVIDGGYSRFYCDQRNKNTDLLFLEIIRYLDYGN
jgi:hypothetical protein